MVNPIKFFTHFMTAIFLTGCATTQNPNYAYLPPQPSQPMASQPRYESQAAANSLKSPNYPALYRISAGEPLTNPEYDPQPGSPEYNAKDAQMMDIYRAAAGTPVSLGVSKYRKPLCGGPYYGAMSCTTGLPRTNYVNGYYRKNGTYVQPYYRSQ